MRGYAMNFKNILLYSVLFTVAFVGSLAYADNELYPLTAKQRQDFIRDEWKAYLKEYNGLTASLSSLQKLQMAVSALCDDMVREKRAGRKKRITEDAFEACVYDDYLRDAIESLESRIAESERRNSEVEARYHEAGR